MKRWILWLLVLLLAFSMTACRDGGESSSAVDGTTTTVTATTTSTTAAPSTTTIAATTTVSKAPSTTTTTTTTTTVTTTTITARQEVTVTVPEGYTFMQIARLLEQKGVCTAVAFYETCQQYTPKSFTIPISEDRCFRMEGYLFPDTYRFYVDTDEETVIRKMLDRFLEIRWIANAFRGIKLAVGILILDAAIRMIRKMPKKPLPIAVTVCAFAAMLLISIFSVRVTSITLMLIAALVGLIVFLVAGRKEGDAG